MTAAIGVVIGVLAGLVIYGLVHRFYWQRWRAYLDRDRNYLQEKIKSVQFTNSSLERQLTAQKMDNSHLTARIADLQREVRHEQARVEEGKTERQALIMHLATLREELAAYKKLITGPVIASHVAEPPANGRNHAQTPVPPTNGKSPISPPLPRNSSDSFPLPEPLFGSNGGEELINEPANSLVEMQGIFQTAHPNGPGELQEALRKARANGLGQTYLPAGQLMEPLLVIPRPRMKGDRLEIIQGIGPAIIKKLHLSGIDTFQALATLTPDRLKEIVGPRTAKLINAEDIISQARAVVGLKKPTRS